MFERKKTWILSVPPNPARRMLKTMIEDIGCDVMEQRSCLQFKATPKQYTDILSHLTASIRNGLVTVISVSEGRHEYRLHGDGVVELT